MTTLLLYKHSECVITGDYDKYGYYFLTNTKTAQGITVYSLN